MDLLEAYQANAIEFVKEEVEYFQEEFNWPLAQCLTRINEDAIEQNDRKVINCLNRIYVACGRLRPISEEQYNSTQIFGGTSTKASYFPKVGGQRYEYAQTDQEFEEANE